MSATQDEDKATTPSIPTARTAPVHLTREQLQREIDAAKAHEPYLIGYGGIQAHAF